MLQDDNETPSKEAPLKARSSPSPSPRKALQLTLAPTSPPNDAESKRMPTVEPKEHTTPSKVVDAVIVPNIKPRQRKNPVSEVSSDSDDDVFIVDSKANTNRELALQQTEIVGHTEIKAVATALKENSRDSNVAGVR